MAALIFDLDGTLIDSLPELYKACAKLLSELGAAAQTPEQVQSYVGNGIQVLTEKLLTKAGADTEPAALAAHTKRLLTIYEAQPASRTKIYPGAKAELKRLHDQGHRMAICTNKPVQPARAILSALGLAPFFEITLGGDSLDVRKPNRRMIEEIQSRLGVTDAVLIGDSEVDAATAIAANVPFILFTEGYRNRPAAQIPHDAVFDDWADFPTALRRVYL